MTVLQGIRAVGEQRLRSRDENGVIITIDLYYFPAVQQWYADITSGEFTLNHTRLTNNLNILWNYARIIDFGMAILVNDLGDPFLINDFSTQRCQIGILTVAEVAQTQDLYDQLRET